MNAIDAMIKNKIYELLHTNNMIRISEDEITNIINKQSAYLDELIRQRHVYARDIHENIKEIAELKSVIEIGWK